MRCTAEHKEEERASESERERERKREKKTNGWGPQSLYLAIRAEFEAEHFIGELQRASKREGELSRSNGRFGAGGVRCGG